MTSTDLKIQEVMRRSIEEASQRFEESILGGEMLYLNRDYRIVKTAFSTLGGIEWELQHNHDRFTLKLIGDTYYAIGWTSCSHPVPDNIKAVVGLIAFDHGWKIKV